MMANTIEKSSVSGPLTQTIKRGVAVVKKPQSPVVMTDNFAPADLNAAPRGTPTFAQRFKENAVSIPFKHALLGMVRPVRRLLGYGGTPQVTGLEAYTAMVPGVFGERARLNVRGPMVTALSHQDDPGDALNTCRLYAAVPKRVDGRQVIPHVLMRSPRSLVEKVAFKLLPMGDFFTLVDTGRKLTGDETAEQIAASRQNNQRKLQQSTQPALHRGAQMLIYPEGTVAGFGRNDVEKVGGLLAFTKITDGDNQRDVPVAFAAQTLDTISYPHKKVFFNFAEPINIASKEGLAHAVQNKLSSLKTLTTQNILGGYVMATRTSFLTEAQAQSIVSDVIDRVLRDAPYLAIDFNLADPQSRQAVVAHAHGSLVKHGFIDSKDGSVSAAVGPTLSLNEAPLPMRKRPTRQHVRNPLSYGGNGILQQASVVPELATILSDVYRTTFTTGRGVADAFQGG